MVSLRLRRKDELEASLRSRHLVSRAEMESRHLPLIADYDRVASWLLAQGLALTLQDSTHTHLFVRGTVDQISRTFGVAFARVSTADGEFTSAIPGTGGPALSLPPDFAPLVLAIDGLQPHIRMHARQAQPTEPTAISGHFTPADLAAARLPRDPANLDGSADPILIAIIMAAAPASDDLPAFRAACGISNGTRQLPSVVNIFGGPTAASQTGNVGEATLDTELVHRAGSRHCEPAAVCDPEPDQFESHRGLRPDSQRRRRPSGFL